MNSRQRRTQRRNDITCGCALKHRENRHMLYRCPACKRWRCGFCDGAADEDIRYCDDCAGIRSRRRERRAA